MPAALPPVLRISASLGGSKSSSCEAVERIVSAVDESALALYYGKARDNTDAADRKAAKKEATERSEQRSALRSALLARASALSPGSISKDGGGSEEEASRFKEAVGEMKAWLESGDGCADEEEKDSHALVLTKYELAMGRQGSALSTLRARVAAQKGGKRSKALSAELTTLYRELGFDHWAANAEELAARNFPPFKQPL